MEKNLKHSWTSLLTKQRFKKEDSPEESNRSHFHKDYDRVIFSHAFRRLSKKTQVHPLSKNDHIHTRLTHSLEVASLGRSFGLGVGEALDQSKQLPEDIKPDDLGVIVQAACLAHDIGNPPFGHTGEDGIRDWFRHPKNEYFLSDLDNQTQINDLLHYEGNAQGFRIVTKLEKHMFDGGMRLTYPTLGTLLKNPWLSQSANEANQYKFSCFEAEKTYLNLVCSTLSLIPKDTNLWSRHPLSYLVEAADDICYRILDLEDAVELNIISWNDFQIIFYPLLANFDDYQYLFQRNPIDCRGCPISPRSSMSLIRGKAMEVIANSVVNIFMAYLPSILEGKNEQPLISLIKDEVILDFFKASAKIAEEKIFRNQAKTEIEVGSYTTLEVLLNAFISAVFQLNRQGYQAMSRRNRSLLDLLGDQQMNESLSLYESYLRVLDFISGMTDQYAMRLANRIGGIIL